MPDMARYPPICPVRKRVGREGRGLSFEWLFSFRCHYVLGQLEFGGALLLMKKDLSKARLVGPDVTGQQLGKEEKVGTLGRQREAG